MTVQLPLRGRGGVVRGYTLVDPEDAVAFRGTRLFFHDGRTGYVRVSYPATEGAPGRAYYLHRLLLGLAHGDGLHADHINGNRLDNRRANLRAVTPAMNKRNMIRKGSVSRYRGVSKRPDFDAWRARATFDGVEYQLGTYCMEEDAAEAVREFWSTRDPLTRLVDENWQAAA